jgi:hypothetical protein
MATAFCRRFIAAAALRTIVNLAASPPRQASSAVSDAASIESASQRLIFAKGRALNGGGIFSEAL